MTALLCLAFLWLIFRSLMKPLGTDQSRRIGELLICTRCGTAGRAEVPRTRLPGTVPVAFPCPACGSEATVPAASPAGRELLHRYYGDGVERTSSEARPQLYGIDGGKKR